MTSTILVNVSAVLALISLGLLLLSGRRPAIALVGALVVFTAAFALRSGVDRQREGSRLRLPLALTPGAPLIYSVDPGPSPLGEETYLVCLAIGHDSAARPDVQNALVAFQYTPAGAAAPAHAWERHLGQLLPTPAWTEFARLTCERVPVPGPGVVRMEVVRGGDDDARDALIAILPAQGWDSALRAARGLFIPVALGAGAFVAVYAVFLLLTRRRPVATRPLA